MLPDILEDADLRNIDASFQAGHHDYPEDSDLEDGEITIVESKSDCKAQSDDEDDIIGQSSVDGAKAVDSNEIPNPATASDSTHLATEGGLQEVPEIREGETHEDRDETSVCCGGPAYELNVHITTLWS